MFGPLTQGKEEQAFVLAIGRPEEENTHGEKEKAEAAPRHPSK